MNHLRDLAWEGKSYLFLNRYDMNYICLENNFYSINNYVIVPLREEDIFLIMQWRNRQIDVLRQKTLLTEEIQKNYYQNNIVPNYTLSKPSQILFSFLEYNKCIGYGGITNIDWESERVELSFLLDDLRVADDRQYEKDFNAFILLIKSVVFDDLQFNRIFTETYDIRDLHIGILEKNGFKPEGCMREHVCINGQKVNSLIHGFIKKQYGTEK